MFDRFQRWFDGLPGGVQLALFAGLFVALARKY